MACLRMCENLIGIGRFLLSKGDKALSLGYLRQQLQSIWKHLMDFINTFPISESERSISHYSGKKTGGSERRETKASSSGGLFSWFHFSLFHRHSQKQWMLQRHKRKTLVSSRSHSQSDLASCNAFMIRRQARESRFFLCFPRN